MNPLIALLIQEAPSIIGAFKHKAPAGTTSEEIILAFEALFQNSDARDTLLLRVLDAEIAAKAAHPPDIGADVPGGGAV